MSWKLTYIFLPYLLITHTHTQTRRKMCLILMTCFTCKICIVGAVSRWMILLHRHHPVRFVAKRKGQTSRVRVRTIVCVCGKHRARAREMIIIWPFHLWLGDLGTIFNLAHLPTVSQRSVRACSSVCAWTVEVSERGNSVLLCKNVPEQGSILSAVCTVCSGSCWFSHSWELAFQCVCV